ncbi:hypothetical protein QEZ54_12390 [Catellatospora sp. KI3]|uniref:diacylglycerol kinase family protein n=1 Tax=Catellatospora sp. KI3 TaxID=3041620 RepID=UPI002482255F|nr:diacylglycerol kinase family protein [Catellatospora sp. KI3]MDI1461774.1 hypothetical protein [Catellatospora sp. KI3]
MVEPDDGCCGDDSCGDGHTKQSPAPRTPVLHCADALRAAGARVETVVACSDAEVDGVLARLDGPPRADGLTWPDPDGKTRLVVAVTGDGQLRHVLRRMVRRYAPPPSKRPEDLVTGRTVPDLPAVAVLPLDAAAKDLAGQLGLPRQPAEVAAAVLGDGVRRLDLLRHDGGSVTLDGVLVGGADGDGRPAQWLGRVEVDDLLLTDGADPLLAVAVANAAGVARAGGLPLLNSADPADGVIEVAVAVPVTHKPMFGRARLRIEVRRARGRAVSVTPRDAEVPLVDDSVAGSLARKRSWWIEPGAWAVYTG